MIGVKIAPHHFSVVGVITAIKGLFTSIVEERNASGCQRESKSTLEQSPVALTVKEAGIVMIIYENAQSVNITEVLVVLAPSISNAAH